jgi:hypothetical protein
MSEMMSGAAIRRRKALPPWLIPLVLMAAFFGFAAYVIIFLPPGPQFVAEKAECDRQVAILLATHDAVELDRAKFIVRWLNCSIGDRLPSP